MKQGVQNMENNSQLDNKAGWGIHVNHKKDMGYPQYPEWVRAGNQMAWTNKGVIVWDESANKVMCLFPQQALDVLDDLRESSELAGMYFCLDWKSYTIPFSEEDRIEWRNTKNRRSRLTDSESKFSSLILSPEQTQELLRYLEKHQIEIRELAEAHAKEVRKVLGRVYSLILSWGRDRQKKEQKSP